MAAEQFSALAHQKIPAFEMPNGDVLYVEYNKDSDMLDVGQPTNAGLVARHRSLTTTISGWMPTCKP